MPGTKRPITVRIDPMLLEQVRQGAARENRSVINFIETALRKLLDENSPWRPVTTNTDRTMTETATK